LEVEKTVAGAAGAEYEQVKKKKEVVVGAVAGAGADG
jgi:hypothetical protein